MGFHMKTTAFVIMSFILSSCGSKSSGDKSPGTPPVVNPEPRPSDDDVEKCLSQKTNLASDLVALEAQLVNLQNAKDLANGILRASCTTK